MASSFPSHDNEKCPQTLLNVLAKAMQNHTASESKTKQTIYVSLVNSSLRQGPLQYRLKWTGQNRMKTNIKEYKKDCVTHRKTCHQQLLQGS